MNDSVKAIQEAFNACDGLSRPAELRLNKVFRAEWPNVLRLILNMEKDLE